MKRMTLSLLPALLLTISFLCTISCGSPAWSGEPTAGDFSSTPRVEEDEGLLIIDLVRRGHHYTASFHGYDRSSLDDPGLAFVDLSRGGKLMGPSSLRRSSRFSVILLDAEPSRLFMKQGYALQSPGTSHSSTEFLPMIQEIAEKHGMDPQLIYAVIEMESGFNPHATSSANAMGLMQLIPETAESLNVKDPFDPYENIQAGVRYLKMQLDRFGSIELALAAYNAGPGAVQNYKGIPPYKETQNYVRIIMDRYYQGIPTR
jgi:hypothetical protein